MKVSNRLFDEEYEYVKFSILINSSNIINYGSSLPFTPQKTATIIACIDPTANSGSAGFGSVLVLHDGTDYCGFSLQTSGNVTGIVARGTQENTSADHAPNSQSTNPFVTTTAASYRQFMWLGVTWDGGAQTAVPPYACKTYAGTPSKHFRFIQPSLAQGAFISPTLGYRAGGSLSIGNVTPGGGTTLNYSGRIALIARWERELSHRELIKAQVHGPLSLPDKLSFCFANGMDYGPHHLIPINDPGNLQISEFRIGGGDGNVVPIGPKKMVSYRNQIILNSYLSNIQMGINGYGISPNIG